MQSGNLLEAKSASAMLEPSENPSRVDYCKTSLGVGSPTEGSALSLSLRRLGQFAYWLLGLKQATKKCQLGLKDAEKR